ncbi:unnamed protein product [Leptidea sinapis]|uniref:Uncharacterized protein n=1 Tax=Leptidea sinapis TaxID=189913 RepID=A0A5E4Q2N5_9NEOP|nr:unnamed protein product [Leptidea sinapis]
MKIVMDEESGPKDNRKMSWLPHTFVPGKQYYIFVLDFILERRLYSFHKYERRLIKLRLSAWKWNHGYLLQ